MKKLTVTDSESTYEIALNKYKVIFGRNYKIKLQIRNIIKQIFEKSPLSESQEENNLKLCIYLDEKRINSSNTVFFEVNQFYDLNNDLKMQSKSLVLKYFESIIQDFDFSDEFFSINTSLKLFESLINEDTDILKGLFLDIGVKQIVKLLEPTLISNGFKINQYDLDYERLIVFQLNLILEIAKRTNDKNLLLLIDIPNISEEIKKTLDNLPLNVVSMVFCSFALTEIEFDNIASCENKLIDFADEDVIYDLLMNIPFNYDKEEIKMIITTYFNKNEHTNNFLSKYL